MGSQLRDWIAIAPQLVYACTMLAQTPEQQARKHIEVTLLGTSAGPPAHVGQAGISTLIEAGGDRLLFDAGRGCMERLVRSGRQMDDVSKLFITHLHSDHIVDIPDLMLTPWSAPAARRAPLEVWGPQGTRDMMHYLQSAFAFDIHIRRDVDEKASPEGIKVFARDIQEGVAYEKNGVKITSFLVDHGPVKPAYGFRLDYGGHSVALSGDTRPSENLVKFCRGVDVLIHEVIDPEVLRKQRPSEQLFQAILRHHTTPEQAASIFTRVQPRLAVYSHAVGTSATVDQTRTAYSGQVEMGEDLMSIDISDEIHVQRGIPNARE